MSSTYVSGLGDKILNERGSSGGIKEETVVLTFGDRNKYEFRLVNCTAHFMIGFDCCFLDVKKSKSNLNY